MTGQDILKLGKNNIGEIYVLGAVVPKNNSSWKGPWDCAEFTSWLFYQVGKKLYGCSSAVANPATADAYTGYWRRDAEHIGKIVTVDEAARMAGAFVLRAPAIGLIWTYSCI